eukprot:TRINITY_DN3328_c0_g2_i5.p3 TRINITY_DN3328_c0_g2~~TRINITY_DN3328_c0_g2_i5.p3  ORF type:complete len:130 (-),score=13.28 TRINITY_DN3328_c0_g2_i5:2519-2908(-)
MIIIIYQVLFNQIKNIRKKIKNKIKYTNVYVNIYLQKYRSSLKNKQIQGINIFFFCFVFILKLYQFNWLYDIQCQIFFLSFFKSLSQRLLTYLSKLLFFSSSSSDLLFQRRSMVKQPVFNNLTETQQKN